MRALFALDGRLAQTLLVVFEFFLVSVNTIIAAVPALAFQVLVGAQPTHLAIWLGVASLLPLGPAVFATLVVMTDVLRERGWVGGTFSRFWNAWMRGVRVLAWWWIAASALLIVLCYNAAMFPRSVPVLAVSLAGAVAIVLLTISLTLVVLASATDRRIATLVLAVAAIARRPHVAAAWLVLVALTAASSVVPVVGPSLMLFLPALCAAAILIIDYTFPSGGRRIRVLPGRRA